MFKKSGKTGERKKLYGIKRRTLLAILEAAKETYPDEFTALLRYNPGTGLINEFLMLPGTISGRRSAQLQLHMMPIDFSVAGSVHSHPSGSCLPSREDLHFFEKVGAAHIIVCMPYNEESWACYTFQGEPFPLEVVA
jgi:proteasome lid subunit RPN8/RPN11